MAIRAGRHSAIFHTCFECESTNKGEQRIRRRRRRWIGVGTVPMAALVVGFDGSPAAERALERAAALSGQYGRVVIVTASVSLPQNSIVDEPIAGGPSPEERNALLDRAATALR